MGWWNGGATSNTGPKPGESRSDYAARMKRLDKAKAKVTELVDAGVSFNPQGASQHLRNRAAENLNMSGGARNVPGTRSGSTQASVALFPEGTGVTRMSAPRPRKKKTKSKKRG